MVSGGGRRVRPFGARIELFRHVGGGVDPDGNLVSLPIEAAEALDILYLCDRFKVLPSQVLAEDASIMRMIQIERLVRGGE